jgi:hypothetical protein
MPVKSMKQLRLMLSAAEGNSETGVSKKVAKKFLKETPRKKWADLPEEVKSKRKDGSK